MEINRLANRSFRQLMSSKTGEEFSLSSVISGALGVQGLFISHEILGPGKSSSAPHFHNATDEVVFVTKGCVVAKEGSEELTLLVGDSACFKAQSGLPHFISNQSSEVAEFVLIRCRLEQSDVVYG
ncbi:cupin domain-containing protein [Bdellovibrio bacteriovorus]|uniref:cupin domain-containing protein n=1 Tax=Bdellovibrio bacteriovorus TaxID=959 RepID=UPI0035A6F85A